MKKQQGFSLLELTIVLLVIGSTVFIARTMIPSVKDKTAGEQQNSSFQTTSPVLQFTETQLLGFILSHNRLPCPDTNNDGHEDCGTGGAVNQVGTLPYRTMKLPQPALNEHQNELRYGVYRNPNALVSQDMDLARSAIDRFSPLLPPELEGRTSVDISPFNALDFCWALRTAARLGVQNSNFTYVGPQAQALNQAFVLADPGRKDANDNGSLFDGSNGNGLGFELPDSIQTRIYDDRVLSVGFYRLAARLRCPEIIASANGAARTAYAAYDQAVLTEFYTDLMRHAHNEAIDGIVMASVGLAIATADVAIAAGQTAISIADAVISRGGAAGVGAVIAVIATAASAAGLGTAIYSEVEAVKGEKSAKTSKEDAIQTSTDEENRAVAARNNAIVKQNRGWLQ